jgi:hypothetical protein
MRRLFRSRSFSFLLIMSHQSSRVNAFRAGDLNKGLKLSLSKVQRMVSPPSSFSSSTCTNANKSMLLSPVVKEQRLIPSVPWTGFLAATAFLPVWAVTILPISAAYQLGKAMVRLVLDKTTMNKAPGFQIASAGLDSGYVVKPSQIIPRSDRKYDIVVLGVTGFCGRLAARYLAKTYGCGASGKKNDDGTARPVVKWAIAGRSRAKLEQVKKELAEELGMDELVDLDVIVVDTAIPATLPALVEQTRVVATTAGPYTLYGSPVCEFCAKFGTRTYNMNLWLFYC